jgi:type IV secretory pathway VirB2 component (pilin)
MPPQLAQYTLNPVPGFFECVVVFNKTSKRLDLLLEQSRPAQLLRLLISAHWQDMFKIGASQNTPQEAFAQKRVVVVQGTMADRLVFPVAVVGTAFMASENDWGLLNLVSLPG